MGGLTSAIRTLTSLPVPGKEQGDLSRAIPWFPLVGFFLGLILWSAGLLWMWLPFSPWPGGCALLLLVMGVLLTRGLHMDGLADWADSMGRFDRDARLAVMKDPHMGVFGGLALIICLLIKWVLLERLYSSDTLIWIIPVMVLSRGMMAELAMTLPYARKEAGMARPFVDGATAGKRFIAMTITMLLCLASGPLGILLWMSTWVVVLEFKAYCKKRFGGITGDLLGAGNELMEVILLALCAVPGEFISDCWGWGPWT